MDGRGRQMDNVHVERLWVFLNHEPVYLVGLETELAMRMGWQNGLPL